MSSSVKQSRAPPKSRFASRAPGQSGPKSKAPGVSRAPGQKQPGGEQAAPALVVRDEQGNDVTPKSLLGAGASPALMKSVDEASEQSSTLDASKGAVGLSSTGSEGIGGDSSLGGSKSGAEVDDTVVASEAESYQQPKVNANAAATAAAAAKAAEAEEATPLTEEQLEEPVHLELRETETFWLLELAGTCVAMDSNQAPTVTAQNTAYEALLKARTDMADMYTTNASQTFNDDTKQKEVQTHPLPVSEAGTQATMWDIHDVQSGVDSADAQMTGAALASVDGNGGSGSVEAVPAPVRGSGVGMSSSSSSFSAGASGSKGMDASFNETGTSSQATATGPAADAAAAAAAAAAGEPTATASKEAKAPEVKLSTLRGLAPALRVLERMVTQNSFQSQHLAYRNIAPNGTALSSTPPTAAPDLKFLWGFRCDESAGRNVSGVEWNPANPDLLAVSYGEFDFSGQRDGLILFWTLKNPSHPDKVISTACGVTCIAFSAHHPNLLAAGMYDGTVCIFDARKDTQKPLVESGHTSGKHTDPVWQLKWVDHGAERGEVLISISTDGRVTQWNMKKGLEHADLMVLKRVSAPNKGGDAKGGSEGIISRRASGLCFDFCVKDPNMYVAGTEDGHIHKCSCSYNEQHLENYFGHSGPVYKLRWSPFDANTFLSASADWSVKLWNQERPDAVFTFQSTTDYVADICWSPTNSTVFASVTGDGLLEVWDVSTNTLDPVKSISTGKPRSCVAFAKNSPILVTGDNDGTVDVYQLVGALADKVPLTKAQQAAAIDKVTSNVQHSS